MIGKTVLIVDDEMLIVCLLEDTLMEAGFDVEVAGSGDEAIARLTASYDEIVGVVTDIRIKGAADGWDVARRARELKSDVPIVYMSGDSASGWILNGVPNSIMIQKPFAGAQVVTAIATLLNDAPPNASKRYCQT